MTKQLDVRGLACPAPVLLAKEVVEKQALETLEVLVDNEATKENLSRFLESRHYTVEVMDQGGEMKLMAHRQGQATTASAQETASPTATTCASSSPAASGSRSQKTMVMIATDRLGTGDEALGRGLMTNFIKTLQEMGDELWRLVLVNNGVKLTVADSPVLEPLQTYENAGLTILVCGTCLNHYELMDAKKVGQTTNMLDIVTAMQLADKVISL